VDASGVGDATSEGEGKTVVYSVFVTTTRVDEFAMSVADTDGRAAVGDPLVVEADATGVPEVSRAAEVDV
jgi:hypothetical protein